MSQEDLEIVRRANTAYAEGGMDAALPFFTDDTVLYSIPEWPDDPEYHGHDGLRLLDQQWRDSFDDFGFEVQELHDAGDSVVSLHALTGRNQGLRYPDDDADRSSRHRFRGWTDRCTTPLPELGIGPRSRRA